MRILRRIGIALIPDIQDPAPIIQGMPGLVIVAGLGSNGQLFPPDHVAVLHGEEGYSMALAAPET